VGVAALVVGLESVGSTAPDPVLAGTSLAVAAAALACGVLYLLRTARPLLDLRILRIQTYRITAFGGSVYRALISAIPFLLPLFFQLAFGWTAALAGLVVIALFAGNVAIKPATTPLMRRFGIRTVMLAAIAGSALCLAAMALLQPTTPLPLMIALLVASGIARSIGFSAYNSVAFADVPAERMTSANTLNAALQELGSGLGVAVGALLVRLGGAVGPASPGTPYRLAFLVLAAIFVVPAVEAFLLPRSAGAVVTGRG
jgi:MFS family permease